MPHTCLCVDDMMHRRDRMAQRADKWWRSAWHMQMCMYQRGRSHVNHLTSGPSVVMVKELPRNTDQYVGRSDRSNQQEI
jgi:hypothetical protein